MNCRFSSATTFAGLSRPGNVVVAEVDGRRYQYILPRSKHHRWKETHIGSLAKAVAL